VKYGDAESDCDLTYRTDFAQVEADEQQVNSHASACSPGSEFFPRPSTDFGGANSAQRPFVHSRRTSRPHELPTKRAVTDGRVGPAI
jgi:hypothetical protein